MRKAITDIFLKAVNCRYCFKKYSIRPALVNIAQPRWIGKDYFKSNPKLLIIMINPAQGRDSHIKTNENLKELIKKFRLGKVKVAAIFKQQENNMSNSGNFLTYYQDKMGLDLNKIAFANIAWCADGNNCYPKDMLKECFERHTSPLIRALKPGITILSGTNIHAYESKIKDIVPNSTVIKTWHFAPRGSNARKEAELKIVRNQLESLGCYQ